MNYSLVRQKFGSSKKEPLINISLTENISSFKYTDNAVYFSYGNKIGKINSFKTIDYKYIVHNSVINSLYYSPSLDMMCVFSDNGKGIYKFAIGDPVLISLLGEVYQTKINKEFKNLSSNNILIKGCIDDYGEVYFFNSKTNMCYKVSNSAYLEFAGNRNKIFATASSLLGLSFNGANDVIYYNGALYIPESGNCGIRRVSGSASFFIKDETIKPDSLCIKNNYGYFKSDNNIYYLAMNNKNYGIICMSNRNVGVDIDDDHNLYMIEEVL